MDKKTQKIAFLLCSSPFQWHNTPEGLKLILAYENFEIPWDLFVIGQAVQYPVTPVSQPNRFADTILSSFKMLTLSSSGSIFLSQQALGLHSTEILDFWRAIGRTHLVNLQQMAHLLRFQNYRAIWTL